MQSYHPRRRDQRRKPCYRCGGSHNSNMCREPPFCPKCQTKHFPANPCTICDLCGRKGHVEQNCKAIININEIYHYISKSHQYLMKLWNLTISLRDYVKSSQFNDWQKYYDQFNEIISKIIAVPVIMTIEPKFEEQLLDQLYKHELEVRKIFEDYFYGRWGMTVYQTITNREQRLKSLIIYPGHGVGHAVRGIYDSSHPMISTTNYITAKDSPAEYAARLIYFKPVITVDEEPTTITWGN